MGKNIEYQGVVDGLYRNSGKERKLLSTVKDSGIVRQGMVMKF